VEHDVLELEVAMDYQDGDHVVEAVDHLVHNFLDHFWLDFPLLYLHQLFKVPTIAVLHEDIVVGFGFNGLSHLDHVSALDSVLVLNFTDHQSFFRGA